MNKRKKYKRIKLNKDTKKLILVSLILIVIIILLSCVEKILENKNDSINSQNIIEYSSIEEILEKYGCTYIKETKSKKDNFYLDIYMKFKYDTFEKNESQERHYDNVIRVLAAFLNNNFRLIDESRSLEIEAYKGENSYKYIINGDDDYFANQRSKNTLKNYNEENISTLQINSNILLELIKNDWNDSNINFGSKDSIFENYDIYFDEGIEVREISKKVYNIIFNNKCDLDIVNNIKPGTAISEIISKLGNPTFGTKEERLIGYKAKEFYIFFSENEISIYRNEKVDMTKFENLVKKYANNEIELKKFMNELTYLWNDYSKYDYNERFIDISYPLKGVSIQMDYDNSKNIQIYNNYANLEGVKELIEKNKITGKLDQNLVYLEEIDRIAKKEQLLYICSMQLEYSKIKKESNLYAYYIENSEIVFVSKDGNNPNISISDNINTGFWYEDTKFIYSVKGKGIFLYDVINQTKTMLLKGTEEYTFESYENNVLTYDKDKMIQISN